jgi:large subunit ribosomal protein L24
MRKLRKWDSVIVIAWSHKWAKSTILKIEWDRVFLHDVNKVKKAVKWQGFVEKEASIHISNVAYFDGKTATKVGIKVDEKTWKKVRFAKKTGKVISDKTKTA